VGSLSPRFVVGEIAAKHNRKFLNIAKGIEFVRLSQRFDPMADIFVSYAKTGRPLASKLVAMLEAEGWKVGYKSRH
jgi:hypothetical protein